MRSLPYTLSLFVRLGLYLVALGALTWLADPDGVEEWLGVGGLVALAAVNGGLVLTSHWVESGWRPLAEKSTVNLTIAADYAREMSTISTATLNELSKHDPQTAAILAKRAFDTASRFQEMT